jgi:hypothetical protein
VVAGAVAGAVAGGVVRKQQSESRAGIQHGVTRICTHEAHGLIAPAFAIADPMSKRWISHVEVPKRDGKGWCKRGIVCGRLWGGFGSRCILRSHQRWKTRGSHGPQAEVSSTCNLG